MYELRLWIVDDDVKIGRKGYKSGNFGMPSFISQIPVSKNHMYIS